MANINKQGHSFTVKYNGIAREIDSPVYIKSSFGGKFTEKQYKAIWDTGATNTVIGNHVAEELGLIPVGATTAYGVSGSYDCNCYLIDLGLPNLIQISDCNVLSGTFDGFDVLIGMDLITYGDFAITNHGDKTTCSFRMPSMTQIDFYAEGMESINPGRNTTCPCGSDKKYKHCCGK